MFDVDSTFLKQCWYNFDRRWNNVCYTTLIWRCRRRDLFSTKIQLWNNVVYLLGLYINCCVSFLSTSTESILSWPVFCAMFFFCSLSFYCFGFCSRYFFFCSIRVVDDPFRCERVKRLKTINTGTEWFEYFCFSLAQKRPRQLRI